MLAYAFTDLTQGPYENVEKEEFDNLQNLFASILSKGISRQLKQGLYREYVSYKEEIPAVRGKIDIQETIKLRLSRKHNIACSFDELSENNLLNQILKTTVRLLLRHTNVEQKYKAELKKQLFSMAEVSEIEPSSIQWSSIRFERNNMSYKMLMCICQLIIDGMLQTTEEGQYRLVTLDDQKVINRLYEKFILNYYLKEGHRLLPSLKVQSSQIPWALDELENSRAENSHTENSRAENSNSAITALENSSQEPTNMSSLLPVMQTDITLTCSTPSITQVLIIDAKFYAHATQFHYNKHTIHSHNLYQIFTYVKNKDAQLTKALPNKEHEVSGLLLYATTADAIQPKFSRIIAGNRISVQTLDLNNDFSVIRSQLDTLLKSNFSL